MDSQATCGDLEARRWATGWAQVEFIHGRIRHGDYPCVYWWIGSRLTKTVYAWLLGTLSLFDLYGTTLVRRTDDGGVVSMRRRPLQWWWVWALSGGIALAIGLTGLCMAAGAGGLFVLILSPILVLCAGGGVLHLAMVCSVGSPEEPRYLWVSRAGAVLGLAPLAIALVVIPWDTVLPAVLSGLLILFGVASAGASVVIRFKARRFTLNLDHYGDTLVRWELAPVRTEPLDVAKPRDGEEFLRQFRLCASSQKWRFGLDAANKKLRNYYQANGMVCDPHRIACDVSKCFKMVFEGSELVCTGGGSRTAIHY